LSRILAGASWIAFVTLGLAATAVASVPEAFVYVSPVPGSRYVSPGNNIALRTEKQLDASSLHSGLLKVIGSHSGLHPGRALVADDGQTLIFVPDQRFAFGERVTVALGPGLRTASGEPLPPFTYDFAVAVQRPSAGTRRSIEALDDLQISPLAASPGIPVAPTATGPLPAAWPPVIVQSRDEPEAGLVFMTPNPLPPTVHGNLVIIDNQGEPMFYRRNPQRVQDFKMQPSGMLTYFDNAPNKLKFYGLDSTYTVVDSFDVGNGYDVPDFHDLQVLPNRHALLMIYDEQPVRMDLVFPGGDPNAIVTGLVLQEIDASKNVVFQWRSWDHFEITDADNCVVDLTDAAVDYVHANAIERDTDGNWLISSRHMNEITKISRTTGNIIWRMGFNAYNNQFSFFGDLRGFSHQHDIRRLPNGNLSLYDNGNCLNPEYSRGMEYVVDEGNKTATLVWEYRDNPDTYGRATGNVQRRAGGTMVNWGFGRKVTDLHTDDSKSLEVVFGLANMSTYRAFRFPWTTSQFLLSATSIDFGQVAMGDSTTRPLDVRNRWNRSIEIDAFVSTSSWFRVRNAMPITIPAGGNATVQVVFKPLGTGEVEGVLYARAINDTELVAQSVAVRGRGPTSSTPGQPLGDIAFAVHPSPTRGPTNVVFDLTTPDHVRIQVLDVQGRVHAVLADQAFPAGRHELPWNARGMSAGLYFVRLERPGGADLVRRMVLVP
jgi:Arylsulfotransferase (ASST)/Abnormal spindle-like microcephaly-assoc'd, ASPM-SPD-2-Hydin